MAAYSGISFKTTTDFYQEEVIDPVNAFGIQSHQFSPRRRLIIFQFSRVTRQLIRSNRFTYVNQLFSKESWLTELFLVLSFVCF